MTTTSVETTPLWMAAEPPARFPTLTEDLDTDVVVVGAGIAGLTTAYLLAEAGRRVVVLERGRCVTADTGHTSAHVTMVTDARMMSLVERFGRDHARAAWDAGLAAIATIDRIVRETRIEAGFDWADAYLHATNGGSLERVVAQLKEEAALADDLGFDAEFVSAVPLFDRPGVHYRDQARIHPVAYLAGVAHAFTQRGGRIFEHSAADQFSSDPCTVSAAGHTVRCRDIVIATHNPLMGLSGLTAATLLQAKLALYSSYVVAGHVPKGTIPDALWWDTSDPYHYLRIEPHAAFDMVILGGADHKTGQRDDTMACYNQLEDHLASIVPDVEVIRHWSGQVIETLDGLPYIGQTASGQYVATGFAGNGMTFGTVAGLVIADAVVGRPNPWAQLFDPGRSAFTPEPWDYLTENADYPYYMIRDRFAGAEARTLRSVRRGQGKIMDRNGARVAVSRDDDGTVTIRSATCTHMGCVVAWNTAERTWDCPCHGSRFEPNGDVISGPAEAPLAPVEE